MTDFFSLQIQDCLDAIGDVVDYWPMSYAYSEPSYSPAD